MNMEPLISVIIPVYNTAKYLPSTLEAVKCQTYRNIQIILVNDCSTDISAEVINEFIKLNPEMDVKYIALSENKGCSYARREALKHVNGDYVHMLDSDDTILPYTYEHALKKLQEEQADVCFWGWNSVEENGEETFGYDDSFSFPAKSLIGYDACCKKISKRIWVCLWNALFATSLCDRQSPIFFDGLNIGEDHYAVNKLLLAANKVCCVKENNSKYLQRGNSLVHAGKSYNRLQGLVLLKMLSDYCEETQSLSSIQKRKLHFLLEAEYIDRSVILIDATIIDYRNDSVKNTLKQLKARTAIRTGKLPNKSYCGAINRVHRIKRFVYDVSPRLYVMLYRILLKIKGQ